jgi:tyrosinase
MDRLEERAAPAAAAPPQRKDQAALSAIQRGRFLAAVNLLNQRGFYGALVSIHSDMSHTMHNMGPGDPTSALGQQRFLPWHRVYLSQLELVAVIPVSIIRAPLTPEILHQRVSGIDAVMQATTYTDFATRLENIHNGVHDWVGGTMSDLLTAPADPIFWMHHANIDRLWWEWQQRHKGQNPNVNGVDAILDPWRYDEPQTRDIANFNYQYV